MRGLAGRNKPPVDLSITSALEDHWAAVLLSAENKNTGSELLQGLSELSMEFL